MEGRYKEALVEFRKLQEVKVEEMIQLMHSGIIEPVDDVRKRVLLLEENLDRPGKLREEFPADFRLSGNP